MSEEEKPLKVKRVQSVYTLVVEVGRKPGDGLPDKATGAALMCYASGVDEAEAVRETVAILKEADLAPLDVSGSVSYTHLDVYKRQIQPRANKSV